MSGFSTPDPLVFLSYRRSDAAMAAQALYLQLRARFGSRPLFMDVNSIPAGSQWPQRIESRLRRATVVLAIIGPEWLKAADPFGRRLLDDPRDWVHREIAEALTQNATVIPVVLNNLSLMPPADALPDELRGLADRQALVLRTGTDEWHRDVKFIGDQLRELGMREREGGPQILPSGQEKQRLPGMSDDDLAAALKTPELLGWEPWEDTLPHEYPATRQELRRVFVLDSFAQAIEFMHFLAPRFDELNHHPRWGNEWVRVLIQLTTWAAGNRITALDIEVARRIESWFTEFKATMAESG